MQIGQKKWKYSGKWKNTCFKYMELQSTKFISISVGQLPVWYLEAIIFLRMHQISSSDHCYVPWHVPSPGLVWTDLSNSPCRVAGFCDNHKSTTHCHLDTTHGVNQKTFPLYSVLIRGSGWGRGHGTWSFHCISIFFCCGVWVIKELFRFVCYG